MNSGKPEGQRGSELLDRGRSHVNCAAVAAAQAGITGVNFAVAETGGLVVCTNEGNADLGVALPPLHIACMGIEKLIPRARDLGVFLRLLARSATGQPITSYSSHFHGPRAGGQLHIVLVDNGRSRLRLDDDFRRSLNCIRCGACMNTCPVYRRSGGHSYQNTVPGPIGSILGPASDSHAHYSLPFACSLCGSCSDVCPVKIDLHSQLLTWRERLAKLGELPWRKKAEMKFLGNVLRRPWLYRLGGWFAEYHALGPSVHAPLESLGKTAQLAGDAARELPALDAPHAWQEALVMSDSREKILRALRQGDLPQVELPDLQGDWIRFQEPIPHFLQMLQSVGGNGQHCDSRADALQRAAQLPVVQAARRVASLANDAAFANLDLADVSDPHELGDLDVLVAEAEFGVAENGAMWVVDRTPGLQAAYFLAEHLILLCSAKEMVHNMHEAYARIDVARQRFGLFLSGPSKTADIEQSLVIGAQGPRSLNVLLYD